MNTLTTTRSPSSCQLRLAAVSCRRYPSPSVFVRIHVRNLGFQIRCGLGSRDHGNGNVRERRKNSKFSIDAFSGWSGDDNGSEVLNESPQKKGWSGGIVGAAVAGVILVAGLTFATVSINKRGSRPKQNTEALPTYQEESLASADEQTKEESENDVLNEDTYSRMEKNEATTENELGHDPNLDHTSNGGETTKNMSDQQDFQEESPATEFQGDPIEETPELNKSNAHDDSAIESSNKLEEDSADAKNVVSFVSDSNSSSVLDTSEQVALNISISPQLDAILEPVVLKKEDFDKETQGLALPFTFESEQNNMDYGGNIRSTSIFDSMDLGKLSSSASIPAPSVVSPALQALPGKVLVPAVVDQVQGQALAALQVLKVIEGDVQPGDLCTRREYARWLVSASSALSRSTLSKVYPAMYIENVTELAFDDITPDDTDFSSIQGLAEAGLIASKLSKRDMNISDQDESSQYFCPESPLSRQDLVSWKMSLEKRLLPVADKMILQQLSGFIDIDKINPDAWPALIADLSAGEQGIVGLAFGYTRLFQPDKPVTKAQAAIALATGESSDIVSEELARIEAESMAEKAVAAHSALVDQVEKDINTYFEKDLFLEREKIAALEKLAEETKQELVRLRSEREEENIKMMKERAAVDSQMEVLSKLRHEAEEELQGIMSNKVEISYEKERLNKLRADAEVESEAISRLQYELEVERKALAMARSWAEDEAKRARDQAKVLEDARSRWESQGIKVIVDDNLREEAVAAGPSWLNARTRLSFEGTKTRAQNLVEKLQAMAAGLRGKSRAFVDMVIKNVLFFISRLKEVASGSMHDLQQSSLGLSLAVKEGAKRVAGDCREGVEKLTQKFKT